VSRSRPTVVAFAAGDDPELVAQVSAVRTRGAGWINIEPVIDEEDLPPEPGPFAFLGGSTHKVPVITWMPGRSQQGRPPGPTTVGLLHASGPRLAGRLRELGLPVPEGWRVTQDHPRRGLVAEVPADVDDLAVLRWMLQAATAVCQVPSTGRWEAAVHTGGS